MMSLSAFIVQLGLLHILRYSRTIAILNATIQESKGRLALLGIFCSAFAVAFASILTLMYGSLMYDYRTFVSSFGRLAIRYMHMDYTETRETCGVFGALLLLVYCFTMLFVLINIMITLINDALARLKEDESVVPPDHEVIQYMYSLFRSKKKPEHVQKGELNLKPEHVQKGELNLKP